MWQKMVRGFLMAVILCAGAYTLRAQDDGPNGPPEEGGRGRDNINARYALVPPVDAPDQDAFGDVRLKRNPVRNGIHVRIFNLEPAATYDVNISRDDVTELLGNITTLDVDMPPAGDDDDDGGGAGEPPAGDDDDDDDDHDGMPGSGKLKLDTKRGDTLPLGAESVEDLVGSTVTVSDADGNVVLTGDIDEIKRPGGGGGDDDGDDVPDDGGGAALVDPAEEAIFGMAGLHDASFRRGDANQDGFVDVTDAVRSLLVLFRGSAPPYCMDAMDANDDGDVNISDPVATLLFLFAGGPSLPAPGAGAAGFDPTPDGLFCDEVRMGPSL